MDVLARAAMQYVSIDIVNNTKALEAVARVIPRIMQAASMPASTFTLHLLPMG